MKKTLAILTAAALMGAATLTTPTPAEARGGRIAAGILGGLAAGAILGGALYGAPYYYGPGPVYYDYPPHLITTRTVTGRVTRCGTGAAGACGACASATDETNASTATTDGPEPVRTTSFSRMLRATSGRPGACAGGGRRNSRA